jgi:hypothetical protein
MVNDLDDRTEGSRLSGKAKTGGVMHQIPPLPIGMEVGRVPLDNEQISQGSTHNPGLFLDFARFTSDAWVHFQHLQAEILRERCPEHVLTHNLMGLFKPFCCKIICNFFAAPLASASQNEELISRIILCDMFKTFPNVLING